MEMNIMSLQSDSCIAALWMHLNEKSVLPKPIDLLNPKVFSEFNAVVNGKIKQLFARGLGERNGADALTLNEVDLILVYPTM